jgi:dolichyl-phosphate-mannose-protein mannosyltransferase
VLRTDRGRAAAALVALLVLLAVGLAIRLAALDATGHGGDAIVMGRWTDNLARYGPWNFYRHDSSIYPALLYAYWPIGVFLDGADQARAIKGLSIPFDMAVAVVAYLAASRLVGRGRALIAPGLYLFNPAVLLAGPVWGQVDSAGTLALLAALLTLATGRFAWAGALAVVAGMVKPQFGLVVLPVAVVAIMQWRATGSRAPVVRGLLGAVAAYVVVAFPLQLDPVTFARQVIASGGYKNMSSANAANIWGLFHGYRIPDGGLLYVGGALLLIGLTASLLPLRRHRDLATILAVGLFVCFAFYFLPTRVHERYLFPAMAVLAPLAATSWRVLLAYLLMTAGFAASMLFALFDTTQFTFYPWVEELVTQPVARIWISLTLVMTAATIVLLLLPSREPASAPRV